MQRRGARRKLFLAVSAAIADRCSRLTAKNTWLELDEAILPLLPVVSLIWAWLCGPALPRCPGGH